MCCESKIILAPSFSVAWKYILVSNKNTVILIFNRPQVKLTTDANQPLSTNIRDITPVTWKEEQLGNTGWIAAYITCVPIIDVREEQLRKFWKLFLVVSKI